MWQCVGNRLVAGEHLHALPVGHSINDILASLSPYLGAFFKKTSTPLALLGYEMIIANEVRSVYLSSHIQRALVE